MSVYLCVKDIHAYYLSVLIDKLVNISSVENNSYQNLNH